MPEQRGRGKERWHKKHRKALFSLIFVATMGALAGLFVGTRALEQVEKKLLDLRFRYFNLELPVSKDIVYIDIDEQSLQSLSPQIGSWPWKRGSIVGQDLVDYVMQGEPALFCQDILFSEYSPKTPGEGIPTEDLDLAGYALQYPRFSNAVLFDNRPGADTIPLPAFTEKNFRVPFAGDEGAVGIPRMNSAMLPYDPLSEYSGSLHSVNHNEDSDGISRSYIFLWRYGDAYYPSLALAALRAKLGVTGVRIDGDRLVLELGDKSERLIPLRPDGSYLLNFYPDMDRFNLVRASSVILSALAAQAGDKANILVPPGVFKDRIVVIGASATGLKDLKVTPMGRNIAGPLMHITAISNVLMGQYLREVPALVTVLSIVAIAGLIVFLTIFVKNGLVKNTIGIVIILGVVSASLLLFRNLGLVVDMTDTILVALASYFGALSFLSLTEGSEKKKISTAMGKYLAPSVMHEVLENYEQLIGEVGEKKDITVLFSDIRGFTSISEAYEAEVVVSMLNTYLAAMIDVVFEYKGTLDKMIGDAIMAFWGAPGSVERKEYLAVKAGLVMHERLALVNKELVARGVSEIRIGVGINTGPMIVGNIGSEKRLDYTLIGDNVNLGSRLEGLTKMYHIPIIASRTTYEKTREDFVWAYVDDVAVKGRETGAKIYTALAEKNEESMAIFLPEIAAFEEGHRLYIDGDFETAQGRFGAVRDELVYLGGLAGLFEERCGIMLSNPPEGEWNGVWKMLGK